MADQEDCNFCGYPFIDDADKERHLAWGCPEAPDEVVEEFSQRYNQRYEPQS